MKEKISRLIEKFSNIIYDDVDKKFNFPPTMDTIAKKIIIPAGALALAGFLYDMIEKTP